MWLQASYGASNEIHMVPAVARSAITKPQMASFSRRAPRRRSAARTSADGCGDLRGGAPEGLGRGDEAM
jgi:hypothetical protein